MELNKIILFSLSALCLLCAWLVPRQLRKRWEAKYKRESRRDKNDDPGKYTTLGELSADYLDKALDRGVRMIVLGLRDTMWQMMLIFLTIILAAMALD